MKPKFKRGDHIISSSGSKGIIIYIEEESDGYIRYIVSWNHIEENSIYDRINLESNVTLDLQRSRNKTLSKILDK